MLRTGGTRPSADTGRPPERIVFLLAQTARMMNLDEKYTDWTVESNKNVPKFF